MGQIKDFKERIADADYAILSLIARHRAACGCNGCRYWVRHKDIGGKSGWMEEDRVKAEIKKRYS